MAAQGSATEVKRRLFRRFIDRHVRPHECIRAVVVYGSVAIGAARTDSDVDAYVFMDPVDLSLIPAEAIWDPEQDTFRSIFADPGVGDASVAERSGDGDLQIDLARVSLAQWRSPEQPWPRSARAALADPWVAFERPGTGIGALLAARVPMTPVERRHLLDEALLAADGLLDDPVQLWERDEAQAWDTLNALWEALLTGTYAVNSVWPPYRGRSLRGLRTLPWLGGLTDDRLFACVAPVSRDRSGFLDRAGALACVQAHLLTRLEHEPDFGDDPTFAAFLRAHDEPGRAWNLAEWNAGRRRA